MVIRPATPHGYPPVSPLKTSAPRRMSPTSVGVLVGVAAVHLGLAVYLYGAHFTPSRLPAVPDPSPVIVTIPRLEPDRPPPPMHRAQTRQVPVHRRQREQRMAPEEGSEKRRGETSDRAKGA